MKKLIISLVLIFMATTIVFAVTPKQKIKPSDYNIGITYEQARQSDKPAIVLFYTDWCTYCRRFMPMYESLRTEYQDSYNFVMLNAESNETLANEYVVSGFPTVYIIDPKIDNRVHLDNGLYDSKYLMKKELDRYLRIRARIK